MKAKLTFDLEDSSDGMAHLRCIKSLSMAIALHRILEKLRSNYLLDIDDSIDTKTYKDVQEILISLDLNLEELID